MSEPSEVGSLEQEIFVSRSLVLPELALERELELDSESSSDFEAPAAGFTECELDGTLGFDFDAMLAPLERSFLSSALFFRLIIVGDTYAVMGRNGAVLATSVPEVSRV